ncbi:MAG: NmrA family NAD(P)-binding protein [Bryobacterales bacterium]|nr:NmrA family NAD(P)-binding protein [Bryobacterales bacterium]
MSKYVIAGITGNVGSVAAGELLARGEKVRGIVRNESRGAGWRERGAEIAAGSLEDREFLRKALGGAAGFFCLLPPNFAVEDFYGWQRRTADEIAGAVKESGVPLVVMLSSMGADRAEGTGPIKGLHYLENALRGTGTRLAAIRASYFQENAANVLPAARQAGIYPNFLPGANFAIPMVATKDIGRLAARLLREPPGRSEVVDLVGPMYSARQVCDALGKALGKPLRVVDIPAGGHVDALMQAGLARGLAEVMAEMYGAIGAGLLAAKGDRAVQGTTGIEETISELVSAARG